ncbi:MAG: hypothetical protein WA870_01355 [Methylovirgula sp.]
MLSIDTAVERPSSVESDARRAVAEMVANGAVFVLKCRDNGAQDFLWELPSGGNRSRCRAIIAETKQNSAAYWRAFIAAIVEYAGEAPR